MTPDLIAIAGDVLDEREVSGHPYNPNDKTETIRDEMARTRTWIEHMRAAAQRAEIIVFWGNHDSHLTRLVAKFLPADLLEFFQDPLELLVQGIDGVSLVEMGLVNKLPDGHEIDMGASKYMALVGDALISHANFTGKHPGDASKKLREWVGNYRRWLGLPEIALAVQTHTHKLYQAEFEGGHYVAVEPGIGGESSIQRYTLSYESKWTPAPIGAVSFRQDLVDGQWKTLRSRVALLRPYR